jgi:hypothetical protein
MKKERHIKVNWSCDLSSYTLELIARHEPNGDPRDNPISVEKLTSIVPQLNALNKEMNIKGWTMYRPKTMSLLPKSWGGIHIDSHAGTEVIDLGFNIPIQNGDSMITRWYDLDGLQIPDNLNWTYYELTTITDKAKWARANADMLVRDRCIDTMLLDGCYLFRSDDPHNVDGRHSRVSRSMLSIRWINLETNKLMQWEDREVLIDACMGRSD